MRGKELIATADQEERNQAMFEAGLHLCFRPGYSWDTLSEEDKEAIREFYKAVKEGRIGSQSGGPKSLSHKSPSLIYAKTVMTISDFNTMHWCVIQLKISLFPRKRESTEGGLGRRLTSETGSKELAMPRGSIRQRSKVRKDSWTVQVYMGVDAETGKKRYHSETVKGAKYQAQRRLTELLHQMDTGTFVEPSKLTVGEYLRQWLRDYAETHVRQRTLEGYRGNISRYILPAIGNIALDKLSARHIQEMEAGLLRDGGVESKGLSPRTVLHIHRVFSEALRHAVRLGTLHRNVAEAVEPPRAQRYRSKTLGWDDVHRFLDQVDSPLHHTLIILDLQTGLRRSEILGLRWTDVDFQEGTISVNRSLVSLPSGGVILTPTKTGKGRMVPVPREALLALRAHRDRVEAGAQSGNYRLSYEAENLVFCREDGSPLRPDSITHAFARFAKKAGMKGLRLHDLRHTHASLLMAQGVHLKVVSERMGHSAIGITGDLYSHVLPTVQLEAVERFGAAWRAGADARMAKEWQLADSPDEKALS